MVSERVFRGGAEGQMRGSGGGERGDDDEMRI